MRYPLRHMGGGFFFGLFSKLINPFFSLFGGGAFLNDHPQKGVDGLLRSPVISKYAKGFLANKSTFPRVTAPGEVGKAPTFDFSNLH